MKHRSIVVYGTSLSAEHAAFWRPTSGQWVGLLRQWVRRLRPGELDVVNASRWGATSAWGRAHLEKRVLCHSPVCVILEFAVNDADIDRGIPLAESCDNLDAMVAGIHRQDPACRVILMITNPCIGRYAGRRPELLDYYQAYREYTARNSLGLIDLEPVWQRWMDANPDRIRDYLPDGLHPAVPASRELLFPVIRERLETLLSSSI